MRGVMRVLSAGLLPWVVLTACNETETASSAVEPAPQKAANLASAQAFTWEDSDGSIVCPSSSGCPQFSGAVRGEYPGVIFAPRVQGVPAYQGPPPIICVAGDPGNDARCPEGNFHARIWPARKNQIACTPGDDEGVCAQVPGYAFFCDPSNTEVPDRFCLGVSTKIPKDEQQQQEQQEQQEPPTMR